MMKYAVITMFASLMLLTSCKNEYTVERTIIIDAPSELVWEQVKYFKNWNNWSPWYAQDSTMQFEFSGEDGNVESVYIWKSEESGNGSITNTGFTAGEELLYQANFIEPWENISDGYIHLSETDEGKTEVKWGFKGVNKGITSIFLNMDNLIGPDYEKGLTLLKEYTEKIEKETPKPTINIIDFEGQNYMAVRGLIDISSIQSFYTKSFVEIMDAGIEMSGGYPSGIYYTWDMENMKSDMAAAIPVVKGTKAIEGAKIIELPASKAIEYHYYGDYKDIGVAHELMNTYLAANELEYVGPAIEEYVTDPLVEKDPTKWLTRVVYLIK